MGNEDFNIDLQNEDSEEFIVDFGEVIETGEGGGGTSNFNELTNRPKYNNQTMNSSTNIPKVPTKTSELTNDADFQTWGEVNGAINTAIGELSIPTKTSDLTNDGANGTSTYVEANNLAKVATSGKYTDLTDTPIIPDAQIQSNWTQSDNTKVDYIKNKPTIPTVNDATLTITQNGTSKGTFTANDADDTTIEVSDTTYSNFTGTDGVSAGAAGLVPAPATTDTDKFLKSDGTWATAGGGGGGVTVVQTTGTSQTDVMSQNAVTSMVFANPGTDTQIRIGSTGNVSNSAIRIGKGGYASNTSAISIGSLSQASGMNAIALGADTLVTHRGSVALGSSAQTTVKGQIMVGATNTYDGYNSTNYRIISGVHDGQSANDAVNVGQINSVIDAINTALSINIPHIGAST